MYLQPYSVHARKCRTSSSEVAVNTGDESFERKPVHDMSENALSKNLEGIRMNTSTMTLNGKF